MIWHINYCPFCTFCGHSVSLKYYVFSCPLQEGRKSIAFFSRHARRHGKKCLLQNMIPFHPYRKCFVVTDQFSAWQTENPIINLFFSSSRRKKKLSLFSRFWPETIDFFVYCSLIQFRGAFILFALFIPDGALEWDRIVYFELGQYNCTLDLSTLR